jgi:hypothetical protein
MSRHERPEPATDRDRDLASYLAVDLPNAANFAGNLVLMAPDLANALLMAQQNRHGWRIKLAWNDPRLRALRSLGLVEVVGFEPSEHRLRQGLGTYLGDYGAKVMFEVRALRAQGR